MGESIPLYIERKRPDNNISSSYEMVFERFPFGHFVHPSVCVCVATAVVVAKKKKGCLAYQIHYDQIGRDDRERE